MLKKRKPILIQFWGGPGAGKSLGAAGLYVYMGVSTNVRGVSLVREFAKKYAILRDTDALNDQRFITGGQKAALLRYAIEYDFLISDSAIELGLAYCSNDSDLGFVKNSISDIYRNFSVINVFINRSEDIAFEESGRVHNLKESLELDKQIKDMAKNSSLEFEASYIEWKPSRDIKGLFELVEKELNKNKLLEN